MIGKAMGECQCLRLPAEDSGQRASLAFMKRYNSVNDLILPHHSALPGSCGFQMMLQFFPLPTQP